MGTTTATSGISSGFSITKPRINALPPFKLLFKMKNKGTSRSTNLFYSSPIHFSKCLGCNQTSNQQVLSEDIHRTAHKTSVNRN